MTSSASSARSWTRAASTRGRRRLSADGQPQPAGFSVAVEEPHDPTDFDEVVDTGHGIEGHDRLIRRPDRHEVHVVVAGDLVDPVRNGLEDRCDRVEVTAAGV